MVMPISPKIPDTFGHGMGLSGWTPARSRVLPERRAHKVRLDLKDLKGM